jgi:hypothetical protein
MKRVLRVTDLLPIIALLAMMWPANAHAYVGPSAVVGFAGATIGLLFAIFSAIGLLLLWPIKAAVRFITRLLGIEAKTSETAEPASAEISSN